MRRTTVLFAVALIAAACGGNGDGADGGDGGDRDFDRCSVMTADEAAQWLGAPVDYVGPSDVPVGAESTCLYESNANGRIVLVQVSDGEHFFASPGSDARGPNDIADLGEDAWADQDTVAFLKNEFSVRVSQIIGPITVEDLEEMARLIEPRIPG